MHTMREEKTKSMSVDAQSLPIVFRVLGLLDDCIFLSYKSRFEEVRTIDFTVFSILPHRPACLVLYPSIAEVH